MRSSSLTVPITWLCLPRSASCSADSTSSVSQWRTCNTAPNSSANSSDWISAQFVERHAHADPGGESHFAYRDEQAAVRTVVVREQPSFLIEDLDHVEKFAQRMRGIEISRMMAQTLIHLRQRRSAEPVATLAEIDEDEVVVAAIGAELRREGFAYIFHRREGADDERQRRRHFAACAGLLPLGLHRQRILAERNGKIDGRA